MSRAPPIALSRSRLALRPAGLPLGAKEPDTNYRNRVENALPSGFFREALRSFAGMLSFLEYLALPASLHRVISDLDGRGTDLSVFLFIADLLLPRGDLLDWHLPSSRQHTMAVMGYAVDGAAIWWIFAVFPPQQPPPPQIKV